MKNIMTLTEHVHERVDEFEFRYNKRENDMVHLEVMKDVPHGQLIIFNDLLK